MDKEKTEQEEIIDEPVDQEQSKDDFKFGIQDSVFRDDADIQKRETEDYHLISEKPGDAVRIEDTSTAATWEVRNLSVINNVIRDQSGEGVYADLTAFTALQGVVVSGNEMHTVGGFGVWVRSPSAATSWRQLRVEDNEFLSLAFAGIRVDVDSPLIQGSVSGNRVHNTGDRGIWLDVSADISHVAVNENSVSGTLTSPVLVSVGSADVANVSLDRNKIAGGPNGGYSVALTLDTGDATNVSLDHNKIDGSSGGGVGFTHTTSGTATNLSVSGNQVEGAAVDSVAVFPRALNGCRISQNETHGGQYGVWFQELAGDDLFQVSVDHNVIHSGATGGLYLVAKNSGGTGYMRNFSVSHNTIYGVLGDDTALHLEFHNRGVTMLNIDYNTGLGNMDAAKGLYIDYGADLGASFDFRSLVNLASYTGNKFSYYSEWSVLAYDDTEAGANPSGWEAQTNGVVIGNVGENRNVGGPNQGDAFNSASWSTPLMSVHANNHNF